MPNQYFRFKQFLVNQDQCAMKVCTDSCILGAYTPINGAATILDIGTGTGLLALMLAQRTTARIDAVEIELAAAEQARQNIAASPWASRITVYPISLQQFAAQQPGPYDLIICNPPFYAASLPSESKARNVAMHSQELSLPEIAAFCSRFLSPTGQLYILFPPLESNYFKAIAQEYGLNLTATLNIFTKVGGKHIRTVQGFGKKENNQVPAEELFIRDAINAYTPAFKELLQAFYLQF